MNKKVKFLLLVRSEHTLILCLESNIDYHDDADDDHGEKVVAGSNQSLVVLGRRIRSVNCRIVDAM